MTPVLVVGYGNPLRRDDGAGPAVAGRFAGRPGVRVVVAQQLVPELADELGKCERVVFVDAAAGADRVEVRPLAPANVEPALGHSGDPAWLLGLTAAVYGKRPAAWLVTIPARDLGFGEGLTVATAAAVENAVARVEELCTRSG